MRGAARSISTAVVGAGNMGRGVAWSLARAGHDVAIYDVDASAAAACASADDAQGRVSAAPTVAAAVDGAAAVLVSVSNEAAERAVFDEVLPACAAKPVVLNLGTTSVAFARELHARFAGVPFLDAPVSGGPEGARSGALAVMCRGEEASFAAAAEVLDAIGGRSVLLGGPGAGAGAKLSTMLARSGGILRSRGDAESLKFEVSAAPLRNFAKDLDLVLDAGAACRVALPSAALARGTVARGLAGGYGDADWAAVAGTFGEVSKASLERDEKLWAPAAEAADVPRARIAALVAREPPLCVVDDDPTGTQTVHGVAVSSKWGAADLARELADDAKSCFYLLANTRALDETDAVARAEAIGAGLRPHGPAHVVSRSDSTLRGHFPPRSTRSRGLGWDDPIIFVAPTEFARDAAFGYRRSDLRDWVAEKTDGAIPAASVTSLDLATIRRGADAVKALVLRTIEASNGRVVFAVDALEERDALLVALGVHEARAARPELFSRGVVYRCAGSLVAALTAMPQKPLLAASELASPGASSPGGLVVVGSYVGKTTAQLEALKARCAWLDFVEVDVGALLREGDAYVRAVATRVDVSLESGGSVALYTSRAKVQDDGAGGLVIGETVNKALCDVVARAAPRNPAFVVAKGGITSNDVAVRALGVERAEVLGQVVPGVPAWRLGGETRLPGSAYVVFPGNVGDDGDLARVVETVAGRSSLPGPRGPARPSCRDLLRDAAAAGAAVGAFNVYNVEGAIAVKRAVVAAGRPAIVQLHPASLDFGGAALLAACAAVADDCFRESGVPMLVALDHAADDVAIDLALASGVDHVMADGAELSLEDNERWTRGVVERAAAAGATVEAELGKLAGEEDGLAVDLRDAKMTDPAVVAKFLAATGVEALAVTVGNVHGRYAKSPPDLDWARLDAVRGEAGGVPLVLHGASGLPEDCLRRARAAGVAKFNVNTEVRAAAVRATADAAARRLDVLDTMRDATDAMARVVEAKIRAFAD
ncbi:3-hydroxyisobutyrate dehydrogenase [Aureococcus anophagefferens]|nr:3-hydroxyisobutyrate dehydrogenase [Aureococcus anophagefferens]